MDSPFPNLPYFINNGKTITQSRAIVDYIVHASGRPELLGKGEDTITLQQVGGVIGDFFKILNQNMFSDGYIELVRKAVAEKCAPLLE